MASASRRLLVLLAAALVLAGAHAAAASGRARPPACRSAMRSARVVACAAPAGDEEPAEAAPPPPADADAAAPDDGADGLLSSPAFLKKKIEVLEEELATLQAANAGLQAKVDEEARSPVALRLQADFENFRRRTSEQALEQVRRARRAAARPLKRTPGERARAAAAPPLTPPPVVAPPSSQKVFTTIDNVKKLLPVLDNFDRAAALKCVARARPAEARPQHQPEGARYALALRARDSPAPPLCPPRPSARVARLESEEAKKIQNSYMQLYKQMLAVFSKEFGCTEIESNGNEFDFNLHTAIVSVESADVPENHVVEVLQRGFMIGDKLVRPAGVRVSTGPGPKK